MHRSVCCLTVLLCLPLLLDACSSNDRGGKLRVRPLTNRVFEVTIERLARGGYLTEGPMHCFTCHSEREWGSPGAPPKAGTKGGGRIFIKDSTHLLPAPNITPDIETGAGTWTDDMLSRAIREGIGHDGRALSPPMAYWKFRTLSDEDLASVVVYIRSLPPVRNLLPKRRLPPEEEESILTGPRPIYSQPPPGDLTDPVIRGKYLVDVGNCVGCHSADKAPLFPGLFGGGNLIRANAVGIRDHAFSSNITSDPSGIPYYDDSLFIEVMRSGRVRVRELSPLMPWVVFQHMNDNDLRAIFAFLRSLRPVRHDVHSQDSATYCSMCGQEHGEGEYNPSKFQTFSALAVNGSLYDEYAGKYESEDYTIDFVRAGEKLIGRIRGREMQFVPGPDTVFYAREWPAPISFQRDSRGVVVRLVSQETEAIAARKVK